MINRRFLIDFAGFIHILSLMNKIYGKALYANNGPIVSSGALDSDTWIQWLTQMNIKAAILVADDGTVAYVSELQHSQGWMLRWAWYGNPPIHRDRFCEIILAHNLTLEERRHTGETTDRIEISK